MPGRDSPSKPSTELSLEVTARPGMLWFAPEEPHQKWRLRQENWPIGEVGGAIHGKQRTQTHCVLEPGLGKSKETPGDEKKANKPMMIINHS